MGKPTQPVPEILENRFRRIANASFLVVDDDPVIRELLKVTLLAFGAQRVALARNGYDGLSILNEQHSDIIITDLRMAPLNGIGFSRAVRQTTGVAQRQVPILMISGHVSRAAVIEANGAGVNDFLAKPVTSKGLLERIDRLTLDRPADMPSLA